MDYGHELQFGVFVTPDAAQAGRVLELAQLAELAGLDLVTFQDHPYQARFLDTWTLLSVVAAQTSTIRVAPNVANLPLRPPVVLARSVASLDRLSGGRIELGLGAGAFWDAIAANGGPRLTPGQSVDALAEAITIIRAVWDPETRTVHHRGEHYTVDGAKPGPAPAHPVELWLGAYKPRMLALTGAQADGWLPSQAYAAPEELPAMNARIDDAAHAAGRPLSAVRRLYNITPGAGPEQLAALALEQGISTFILSADDEDAIRRFATEIAPAVRELVETERGRDERAPAAAERPPELAGAGAFAVVPTADDGARLSDERAWDDATRPAGPAPDPAARYTPDQQAAGRHLIDVHDALRAELDRLRELIGQVERGEAGAGDVRQYLNRMTIRQNQWTLGVYCASYCRIVAGHHTLEDRSVFPHLRRRDPRLAAVIGRLEEEHDVITGLLERIDGALVAMVAPDGDGLAQVRAAVDLLSDALLSHLSYEERELVEPLARLGFY